MKLGVAQLKTTGLPGQLDSEPHLDPEMPGDEAQQCGREGRHPSSHTQPDEEQVPWSEWALLVAEAPDPAQTRNALSRPLVQECPPRQPLQMPRASEPGPDPGTTPAGEEAGETARSRGGGRLAGFTAPLGTEGRRPGLDRDPAAGTAGPRPAIVHGAEAGAAPDSSARVPPTVRAALPPPAHERGFQSSPPFASGLLPVQPEGESQPLPPGVRVLEQAAGVVNLQRAAVPAGELLGLETVSRSLRAAVETDHLAETPQATGSAGRLAAILKAAGRSTGKGRAVVDRNADHDGSRSRLAAEPVIAPWRDITTHGIRGESPASSGSVTQTQQLQYQLAAVLRGPVAAFRESGTQRAVLEVTSGALGPLRVELTQEGAQLTVSVVSANPRLADLSTAEQRQLEQDLTRLGYERARFSFSHEQGSRGQDRRDHRDPPAEPVLAAEDRGQRGRPTAGPRPQTRV